MGGLRAWKGFRGLSGDLVRRVIQELHPYAQVEFRAKSDPLLGPPTRKIHHGYLVSFFFFVLDVYILLLLFVVPSHEPFMGRGCRPATCFLYTLLNAWEVSC